MHDDIDVLARTIFGEARGEPFLGQVAVAWVVKNRAAHPSHAFGSSLKDVCLRPKQFSCWNADDPQYTLIRSVGLDSLAFVRATAIASLVALGDLSDPTFNADHYCVSTLHPYWRASMTPTITIGHHIFLRS